MNLKRSDIKKRLVRADSANNTATLTMALKSIMVEDHSEDFSTLEDTLRELDCKAHLIAIPAHTAPDNLDVIGFDNKPRQYYLWCCLHGKDEANEKLAEINCTAEQNIKNLKLCGVLVLQATH